MLLRAKARHSFSGSLGLTLLKLCLESIQSSLRMLFVIEVMGISVKLSDDIILAIDKVAVKNDVHQRTTFILCHSSNDIASEQGDLFDSDHLVEESHHEMRTGAKWVLFELLKERADEALLLVLKD